MRIIKYKTRIIAKIIFLLLLSIFPFASCDSFIEVDLPKSQLNNKNVFEDYSTADAALADIYSKIRDNGLLSGGSSGLSFLIGLYSDELSYYGNPSNAAVHFYTNSLLATNSAAAEFWNASYNQIYAANAVVEGSKNSASLSASDKKRLEGEAIFIRALLHFYLVNLFGDIPYITTTDYKINAAASKLSVSRVNELIVADLLTAASQLSSVSSADTRVRPGKPAIQALLARVYLYQGFWPEAANSASAVLNQTENFKMESTEKVFLKDSQETIWQLEPAFSGKNTDEAAAFIFFTAPPPLVALTNNLIESFSVGDLRRKNWTGSVTNGTTAFYFPFKYKEFDYTPSSVEFPIVLRLSEQYLIRAEARAQQGDLIGAGEDLNIIRHRAGLTDTDADSREELLEAVQVERRHEMFTEYGHRFFDLKRTGQINMVLSFLKPGWNSTDVLLPIPQTELSLNQNLRPQNSGY